jgi:hypothetical protein
VNKAFAPRLTGEADLACGFEVVRAFLIGDEGLAVIGSHDLRKGAPVNRHVNRQRGEEWIAATVSDKQRTETYSLRRNAAGGAVLCLARQDSDFSRSKWRRDQYLRQAEQSSVNFRVKLMAKAIDRQLSDKTLAL